MPPQHTAQRILSAALITLLLPLAAWVQAPPVASASPAKVAPPAAPATPKRPSVLLIVSDDHGFGDVGWNNPAVATPNLDALARDGARLDRFYANPICSVTRAALLTGVATLRTGVNNASGLDLRYRILPQAFRDAGYQTWMFGKWHLGGNADNAKSGEEYRPYRRGFDYFYGFLHGAIDYYEHTRHDLQQLDWQRNGVPVEEEGFTTDLLVDDAIRHVKERDVAKPFLLYLAFNAVHGPLAPPPSAKDLSRREKRPIITANVTHMDRAIGRLLAEIDAAGLRETTIVLFFGDNGGQLSQGASNAPLRGEKGETFEGGIRVPAAVRWPGVIKASGRSDQFMSVMDVFPTLCSAAGVPTGVDTPLDGIDLWPALQRGQAVEHPPFVMGTKETACIRSPWKLIRPSGNAAPLLFNIVEDPGETKNLAAERPELVDELSKEIARYGAPARGGEKRGGQKGGDKKQGDPKRGGKKQGDTKEQEKPTRESISNRPAAGVAR
jgi:arylsulfatase A-like enzyme